MIIERPKELLLGLIPSDPISTFLIDDGWHDITSDRRLKSFGTWDGFGGTMKEVVGAVKKRTSAQVGVWMTLEGYWFGIDPKSELAEKYECQGFRLGKKDVMGVQDGPLAPPEEELGDQVMYVPHPRRAKQFWLDWLQGLKADGVDFIKVSVCCDDWSGPVR